MEIYEALTRPRAGGKAKQGSTGMSQTFVALIQHPGEQEWLQSSLAGCGQVVLALSLIHI